MLVTILVKCKSFTKHKSTKVSRNIRKKPTRTDKQIIFEEGGLLNLYSSVKILGVTDRHNLKIYSPESHIQPYSDPPTLFIRIRHQITT